MKAQNINLNKNHYKQSFTGYKDIKKTTGRDFIEFYAPPYDKEKYDLSLQITPVELRNGIWTIWDSEKITDLPVSKEKFEIGSTYALSKDYLKTNLDFLEGRELGYRYKLTPKNGSGEVKYFNEAGTLTEGDSSAFNVITKSQGFAGSVRGPIYHMFINSYAPSKKAKEQMVTRTHVNDAGGNIRGVIDKLKNTDHLDPYSAILSTPVFGRDNVSSHGYWTANPYQLSSKAGTIDDFKDLQIELFKKGKTWISDGAFTSQGYTSPLLADVLLNGKESPYYHWFKMEDEKIRVSILPSAKVGPKDNDAFKHTRYKLIKQTDKLTKKSVYIQFYDDRLVSEAQRNSNSFIDKYDKLNTNDPYEIKEHQDAVLPYAFEINPYDSGHISKLVTNQNKSLAEINNIELLFNFENFNIVTKDKAGKANFWDGNSDLVKMNLSNPNYGDYFNAAGNAQVRNYVYNIGSYWTKNVSNTLTEYISKQLSKKGYDKTLKEISSAFGAENLESAVEAVENNTFKSRVFGKYNPDNYILSQIAEFPFESIEFSNDITATLASPYITARPLIKEHQTISRYDLVNDDYYKDMLDYGLGPKFNEKLTDYEKVNSTMNSLYKNEISKLVNRVLKNVDENIKKGNFYAGNYVGTSLGKKKRPQACETIFSEDNKLTEYGAYLVKILVPEIMKYITVRSILGNGYAKIDENGTISYDMKQLKSKNIADLGSETLFMNKRAALLVEKMRSGINNMPEEDVEKLASSFAKRFSEVSLKDLKVSEAILEQTQAGLNWRFDAAKDIADLDKRRSDAVDFESSWDETIDFWKHFVDYIKDENPSSYVIAEITNLWDFYKDDNKNDFGKYVNPNTAERIFYESTGSTTGSNYSHMFSSIPALFGQVFENAALDGRFANLSSIRNTIESYSKFGPFPMVTQSHVFTNNHDKPRPLHCLALDMRVFLDKHDTSNRDNENKLTEVKNQAIKELFCGKDVEHSENLSMEAVAVGSVFNNHFNKVVEEEKIKDALQNATIDLALGKFKDNKTEDYRRAKTFACDEFEISLNQIVEQAIYSTDDSSLKEALKAQKSNIVDKMLESVLAIPMQKYSRMWELMATSIGNPTLYGGDEYAQSGHEDPSKNNKVKNRYLINHDVIKNENRPGTIAYNKKINAITRLHNKKGLSALASGAPVSLNQDSNNYYAIYKNNERGSEVISVYSSAGLNPNWNESIEENPAPIMVSEIKLDGLKGGITPGTEFSRLIYDDKKSDYVNEDIPYVVKKEGNSYKLVRKDGNQIRLNSTTAIFYKTGEDPRVTLQNSSYRIPQ